MTWAHIDFCLQQAKWWRTPPKRSYRMVARAEAAAATQERILSSAWRHFAEQPYNEVRLIDIAREAAVTVQTIHLRFGTKDELFVTAWRSAIGPEGARRDRARVGDVRGGGAPDLRLV